VRAVRVAYLGPPGTFSDEALGRCALAAPTEALACATLEEAYEAALVGDADAALLPIENSIEGAVHPTLDLLVHRPGLVIMREIPLPIDQCLLATAGTRLEDVTCVLSHPQALGQCRAFLLAHLPAARLEPTHSTADGARRAARERNTAAIGSRAAAARYDLVRLAEGIQDTPENTTKFVLIGHTQEPPTGRDRTSIALTLDADRPGGLYEVLGELATRGINLSKIESRPTKRGLGQYVFFIDFEGHQRDAACNEALEAVSRRARRLVVLGSYPRD
jgi:prephenate dehydratase